MPKDWSKVPYIKEPFHKNAIGFDTETSHLSPEKGGIVQIGAIAHDHKGNETGRFHSLVNPGNVEYDPRAMNVNGILMDDIQNAPHIKDVLPQLVDFFRQNHQWNTNTDKNGKTWKTPQTHIVGHNLPFDLRFLENSFKEHQPELLDEFRGLTRHQHDTQQHGPVYDKQHTLKGLGKIYGVPNKAPHTALGDIDQTLGVYHQQRGMQRYIHNHLAQEQANRHQEKMGDEEEGRQQFFANQKAPNIKWIS
jgi:DNA polymerase III epsilon subunit-like protein